VRDGPADRDDLITLGMSGRRGGESSGQ